MEHSRWHPAQPSHMPAEQHLHGIPAVHSVVKSSIPRCGLQDTSHVSHSVSSISLEFHSHAGCLCWMSRDYCRSRVWSTDVHPPCVMIAGLYKQRPPVLLLSAQAIARSAHQTMTSLDDIWDAEERPLLQSY